jgi:7,8-dihydropterin-6-yl-methyl-4-(beta-D-ribofuranosyl)aminobenzene 5'-phosphate synthase
MGISLKEIDRLEIVTVQDNTIDLLVRDNNEVIQRALPLKGIELKNSILAEHGFSALVTASVNGSARTLLFDFGFSGHGAAYNAEALNLDLTAVEATALSHGHPDHTGGFEAMVEKMGGKKPSFVCHPAAFRNPRYSKITEDFKVQFPALTREQIEKAGLKLRETAVPLSLLDDSILFLGEIPRATSYETVPANFCYEEGGAEKHDEIDDDTALAANVRGKGLVVLSGCAHAGIVNTVNRAREVTGVDRVHAVMGGFHLAGADIETVVKPTADALAEMKVDYLVPTHCTGREAVRYLEERFPEQFILNMSGTRLTFAA